MLKILFAGALATGGAYSQEKKFAIEDNELSTLRAITVTKRATFSDLCKIVLIQRGELESYATDAKRCARLGELGIYNTESVDYVHLKPLNYGAVAKALINAHGVPKTLMFRLTKSEWYALQNAEAEGLIPPGSNAWDVITGEDLVTFMDEAMEYAKAKENWMQPENPYKEFGFESYKEMEENARKVSGTGEKK